MANEDFEAGRQAATFVLDDAPEATEVKDPRTPDFARGALAEFTGGLQATRGFMRRVVDGAEAAAEDLAVEVFQGLVEVLQNADDLRASEVRIAVLTEGGRRQLLIVHDGEPVTVHHVLAMNLPFLTTKSEDEEKLGRFGIGLKTLGRIASSMDVHGSPYHFAAKGLGLRAIDAAPAIPGFYDPARETLLVLELRPGVSTEDLVAWFGAWPEDNLLFLRSVRQFRMRDLVTGVDQVKGLEPDSWEALANPTLGMALRRRRVRGTGVKWEVYAADCDTPDDIDRSHKATGATTRISVALASGAHQAGVFIAFRTRVPSSLPFSLDAQFDPTAAREGLIDNDWNKWLVARCGDVVAAIVCQRLAESPEQAWAWAPLPNEAVGVGSQVWPGSAFTAAMTDARATIAGAALLRQDGDCLPLADLAYEAPLLATLFDLADVEMLAPGKAALRPAGRDPQARWRAVLTSLDVATLVSFGALTRGFHGGLFNLKPVTWWIEAAALLTRHRSEEEIFGVPCWLAEDGTAVSCRAKGSTDRPLVLGPPLSEFARRWNLMLRLHDAYLADGETCAGVTKWLFDKAAVTPRADPAVELAAFAEVFAAAPHAATDEELRELQRRFDELSDRQAAPVAAKVGAAILLDGYAYRGGRKVDQRVRPDQAYLPRRIDSDYPDWPDAADGLPGIAWVSPSYDERLRSGPRGSRRRPDGLMVRGPRRFLMLLGAQCWPRLERIEQVRRGGGPRRTRELRAAAAEYVRVDWTSPDLDRVLAHLARASKKEKRTRSAGLVRALSRHWDRLAHALKTPSYHQTPKNVYERSAVTSHWLGELLDNRWVAVGTGTLVLPNEAVVKTPETQGYYTAEHFIAHVAPDDLRSDFGRVMRFITDVRARDLVRLLVQIRDAGGTTDSARVLQLYRSLAKLCPRVRGGFVGDLAAHELKAQFEQGPGLIWIAEADAGRGAWRRPSQLLRGRDVLHEPERFVPAGPTLQDLWVALGVEKPSLDDCVDAVRRRAKQPHDLEADAALIDIYHYMESLAGGAIDRALRDRLRTTPVVAFGKGWVNGRPVFYVADRELRAQLAAARPDLRFWAPPWDVETVMTTATMLGLVGSSPKLAPPQNAAAEALGESMADRFGRAIDHLSNEFARNDPATREALTMAWETLRDLPLSIYEAAFEVRASDPVLGTRPITLQMRAVLDTAPHRLHISQDDLPGREGGGRSIASLFAPAARRRVEAEWVVAWMNSADRPAQMMRMASDEAHRKTLEDLAAATAAAPKTPVKVTPLRSKVAAEQFKPRLLKTDHGPIATVSVTTGSPTKTSKIATTQKPLAAVPPALAGLPKPPTSAPPSYTTQDLEQRGWDVLTHVLNASNAQPLVDFRARHRVGADGVIDWKTFVELKATGRGPLGSVELSNSEYERAIERGQDFILALVSGLEEGEHGTEVRLILDPARGANMRPLGGVRLSGLLEAPAVIIQLADSPAGAEADVGDLSMDQ